MVSTRARVKVNGGEANVISRNNQDPDKIIREGNKRKREQDQAAQGSAVPPKKRQKHGQKQWPDPQASKASNTDKRPVSAGSAAGGPQTRRNALSVTSVTERDLDVTKEPPDAAGIEDIVRTGHHGRMDQGVTNVPDPGTGAATIPLPESIKSSLLNIRKNTLIRQWLEDKLKKVERKRAAKRKLLSKLMGAQKQKESSFEKRLEAFVPANEQEQRLLERYNDLGQLAQSISSRFAGIDRSLTSSRKAVANVMLQRYGDQIPSEERLRANLGKNKPLNDADFSSNEAEAQPEAPKELQGAGPRKVVPGRLLTTNVAQDADHDRDAQEQNKLFFASTERTRARERFEEERNHFDSFVDSYGLFQQAWLRQRLAGAHQDSLSDMGRRWALKVQEQTQLLKRAELQYEERAAEAKMLKVKYVSPNQSSKFPSDDGIDQELYDIEIGRHLTDIEAVNQWINDEWEHPHPSTFDHHQERPIRKSDWSLRSRSQIAYGAAGEDTTKDKGRVRIDLWNNMREAAWKDMMQQWPDASSNRFGKAVSLPPSPKPDELKLLEADGDEDGEV